jgi:hypothetical protein
MTSFVIEFRLLSVTITLGYHANERYMSATRKLFLFGAVLTLLGPCSVLNAAEPPQPFGIPSGHYVIASPAGGGTTGVGTIPTYCLDKYLQTPTLDNTFRQILYGGSRAHVEFPGGKILSLQETIDQHILTFTGAPEQRLDDGSKMHVYQEMSVTGPPGTVIVVDEPLALTAAPQLGDRQIRL